MASPTRAQISADATWPVATVEAYIGGVWTDISADVIDVQVGLEAGGGAASGVAMGPSVTPSAGLTMDRAARAYEGDRLPVRISLGFGGGGGSITIPAGSWIGIRAVPTYAADIPIGSADAVVQRFGGVLMDCAGSAASATRSWGLRSWDALIEGCEVRSPLLRRRPIFTATTISSVEDPGLTTWRGGLGNYILWQCGGRPYEQASAYPSAVFYYSCAQALIAPEWSWTNGENPWEVLRKLCRAAGGQIFIDGESTVRYVDPITLATGTPAHTFTDEVLTQEQRAAQGKSGYGNVEDRRRSERAITGATCAFVGREVSGAQEIYANTTPHQIAAGASITLACDLQLPAYVVSQVTADGCVIRTATKTTSGDLTVAHAHPAAQRVDVTITNTLADPVMLDAVRIVGRPLAAGEEGSERYGDSTGRMVSVEDSYFVQSPRHAAMLCRMLYDAETAASVGYRLTDCAYDPDREVGEIVGLTSSDYGLAAERCRVVRIDVKAGAWMDVDLAPLGNLPTRDSVHIVGGIATGDTKDMAY